MSFIAAIALMDLEAKDKEVVSIGTSSVGLSSSKYDPGTKQGKARGALIQVKSGLIYWTCEGSDADSTCMMAATGQSIPIRSWSNIKNFRAIRAGDVDAEIAVLYFW